jgi:hypothetical protein
MIYSRLYKNETLSIPTTVPFNEERLRTPINMAKRVTSEGFLFLSFFKIFMIAAIASLEINECLKNYELETLANRMAICSITN